MTPSSKTVSEQFHPDPSHTDQIKNLNFTSWWIENGEKNLITVVFQLDGNPHEIIIKDTKYYVKEIYSADKRNTLQLAVSANA